MLSGTAGTSLQESRRPPLGAVARERSSGGVTADPDTLKCASPAARQSQLQPPKLGVRDCRHAEMPPDSVVVVPAAVLIVGVRMCTSGAAAACAG